MEHQMEQALIEQFQTKLKNEEKSSATIEKYLRDIKSFYIFVEGKCVIDKNTVIAYKEHLIKRYAIASANSMLAALNQFFKVLGWFDCVVRALKVQREAFRARERELTKKEYLRLLAAAKQMGNDRLYLLMETICATGIRVSELPFITVESLRTARAQVSLKGKTRTVILPKELCKKLRKYVQEKQISSGSIFITRSGKPMDRSNILHEMKKLGKVAGVDVKKIFPHNLRHLFAVTYYKIEKNICHLADILGHSNINTTRIYTMISCEEQSKQIKKLGLVV